MDALSVNVPSNTGGNKASSGDGNGSKSVDGSAFDAAMKDARASDKKADSGASSSNTSSEDADAKTNQSVDASSKNGVDNSGSKDASGNPSSEGSSSSGKASEDGEDVDASSVDVKAEGNTASQERSSVVSLQPSAAVVKAQHTAQQNEEGQSTPTKTPAKSDKSSGQTPGAASASNTVAAGVSQSKQSVSSQASGPTQAKSSSSQGSSKTASLGHSDNAAKAADGDKSEGSIPGQKANAKNSPRSIEEAVRSAAASTQKQSQGKSPSSQRTDRATSIARNADQFVSTMQDASNSVSKTPVNNDKVASTQPQQIVKVQVDNAEVESLQKQNSRSRDAANYSLLDMLKGDEGRVELSRRRGISFLQQQLGINSPTGEQSTSGVKSADISKDDAVTHAQGGDSGRLSPAAAKASHQPAANRPAPQTQNVAVRVVRAATAGQDSVEIELRPPELGRVDVKMDFGSRGAMKIVVSADRSETLDMLQRDARFLQKALEEAGFSMESGIEFGLGGNRGREDRQDSNIANASNGVSENASEEAEETMAPVARRAPGARYDLTV